MLEVIFLSVLAIVWIIFAVVQDVKSREIANWLSFSLIIFALGFRFFYSLFSGGGFSFFYQGLIGLGIFFVIGNLFYYGRIFAGGDAKLMIALGAVLPFYGNFLSNVKFFGLFLILFFLAGSVYGLITSVILGIKNSEKFKKEFINQFKSKRKFVYFIMVLSIVFLVLGFIESILIYFGILIFIFPYLYLSAKSVDEVCMVKKINPKKLTEGDWLYEDVKIGDKVIKKGWDGLEGKEIKLLQKKKYILVRYGIPFSPAFLIGFLILILFYFLKIDLWNSFW